MSIKTFPIVMTEEEHGELRTAAMKSGRSIKDFIKDAIKKEIKGVK